MPHTYDAIVIGVGGVGSSAVYHLAKSGMRVLGLEQFGIAHDLGSSHGETRAIRKAYFEHPDYVPLLLEAYESWRNIEQEWGSQLLHLAGLMEIGPADGVLIPGVMRASRQHNLELEVLSRKDFSQRMPGFVLREGDQALFETDAGYLLVEESVRAMATLAERHGADIAWNQCVESWEVVGDGVCVRTSTEEYHAKKLVLTTGAWSVAMLSDLGIPCRVLKKHLHWVRVPANAYRETAGSPLFFYETTAGCYYGFPQLSAQPLHDQGACIKLAEHTGGETVPSPGQLERSLDRFEQQRVKQFLADNLPLASSDFVQHSVCMYTMSPDEHFIIDWHPEHAQVCFAAGLSGHGFKFASILGSYLASMVGAEVSDGHPIPFLSLSRFNRL